MERHRGEDGDELFAVRGSVASTSEKQDSQRRRTDNSRGDEGRLTANGRAHCLGRRLTIERHEYDYDYTDIDGYSCGSRADWGGGVSDAVHAVGDAVADDRAERFSEAREPADDGQLQGARRAEQDCDADSGAGEARRGRGERGESCAGGGVSRDAAGDSRGDRDAADDSAGEGDGDARVWRGGGAAWRQLRRGLHRGDAAVRRAGDDVYSSVRRSRW